jgi:hypothetical protein
MNVANSVFRRMAIILKVNKVHLFVSSVLFVFCYHSPNFLDTPRIPGQRGAVVETAGRHVSTSGAWRQSHRTVTCAVEQVQWGRFVCVTVLFHFLPNFMTGLLHTHLSTGAVSSRVI